MFHVWIDGHDMQIIEADGVRIHLLSQSNFYYETDERLLSSSFQVELTPYPVDNFPIAVAQRYSVLVTARNDTSSNWALNAVMDPVMFDEVSETERGVKDA